MTVESASPLISTPREPTTVSSAETKKIVTDELERRNLPFFNVTEVTPVMVAMSTTPSTLLRSTVKTPVPNCNVNTEVVHSSQYLLLNLIWLKVPVANKVPDAATLMV